MKTKDVKPCKQTLKVVLTEQESLNYGKESARMLEEKTAFEEQLQEIKDSYKGKLSACDALIHKNARLINSGYEYRSVDCEWRYNWKDSKKTLIRNDTGEVINEVDIENHERQEGFVGEKEPAEAA